MSKESRRLNALRKIYKDDLEKYNLSFDEQNLFFIYCAYYKEMPEEANIKTFKEAINIINEHPEAIQKSINDFLSRPLLK